MSVDAHALLTGIDEQLRTVARRVGEGFDIAPAQRARIEGMAAAALLQGVDTQRLLAVFRAALPQASHIELDAQARALRFDIWQRRAPVEPTTSD